MADHDEVARPELARMVRGRGRFLDDTKLQGMCYAAFVRSEYAHANIVSIDVSAAMEVPGRRRRDPARRDIAAREPGTPRCSGLQRIRATLRPLPCAARQGDLRRRPHRGSGR